VRAAEEQRDAKALGGSDGDVRTLLARGRDEGEGQQVRGHGDQGAAFLRRSDDAGVVKDPAGNAGLLEDDAVDVAVGKSGLERSEICTSKPSASARPFTMAMVCGRRSASRTVLPSLAVLFLLALRISSTASATAVASSSRDALATGSPVRSWTMVWKFSSASSRPWEISGWYGV
jgi:hypothetical protein